MNTDFKTIVVIDAKPETVFESLTLRISDWWGNVDNIVQQEGDLFTVSWGAPWYQFKVTHYQSDENLVWECIDANQIIGDLKGVQKEWVGTTLHWELVETENHQTQLNFIHKGLVPDFICYDVCAPTWERFISVSLREFLEK